MPKSHLLFSMLAVSVLGVGVVSPASAMGPARKVVGGVLKPNTNIPNDKQEMMQRDSAMLHNLQNHGTRTIRPDRSPRAPRSGGSVRSAK